MPKIKEIKKVESKIKEINSEKKDTLEEEVEEIQEDSSEFFRARRFNATSTLAQSETPQENRTLQRVREKEDEAEVNFRPSYTGGGGNPYSANKYTPVGSAESSASNTSRQIGEQNADQQNQFIARQEMQSQEQGRSASRPESSYERSEVGQGNQKEKDRRRQMM